MYLGTSICLSCCDVGLTCSNTTCCCCILLESFNKPSIFSRASISCFYWWLWIPLFSFLSSNCVPFLVPFLYQEHLTHLSPVATLIQKPLVAFTGKAAHRSLQSAAAECGPLSTLSGLTLVWICFWFLCSETNKAVWNFLAPYSEDSILSLLPLIGSHRKCVLESSWIRCTGGTGLSTFLTLYRCRCKYLCQYIQFCFSLTCGVETAYFSFSTMWNGAYIRTI